MQVLFHKAELTNLEVNPADVSLPIGAHVSSMQEAQDLVGAYVTIPSRWPFGIGGEKLIRLGGLDPAISPLICSVGVDLAQLRVRVVEIVPSHLSESGIASVYVSIWGAGHHSRKSSRSYRIFSDSRINESSIVPARESLKTH
jgi:hypothetical protein